jgi:HSP20 family protein
MIYWLDKMIGLDLPAVAAGRETNWIPATDIYRSQCGWLIKLELAGVRQNDLSINASGKRLTISGFRRDLIVNEDWSHYSLEIAYSRFERIIEMPCSLDRAGIKVELRDGMLMIIVTPEGEDR